MHLCVASSAVNSRAGRAGGLSCPKRVHWGTEGPAGWQTGLMCVSPQHEFLLKLKVMYTVGYSSSLVMLLIALSILCAFRWEQAAISHLCSLPRQTFGPCLMAQDRKRQIWVGCFVISPAKVFPGKIEVPGSINLLLIQHSVSITKTLKKPVALPLFFLIFSRCDKMAIITTTLLVSSWTLSCQRQKSTSK